MSDVLAATLKEAIDGAGDLEHKSVLQVELGALLSVKLRTAFVVNAGLRSRPTSLKPVFHLLLYQWRAIHQTCSCQLDRISCRIIYTVM